MDPVKGIKWDRKFRVRAPSQRQDHAVFVLWLFGDLLQNLRGARRGLVGGFRAGPPMRCTRKVLSSRALGSHHRLCTPARKSERARIPAPTTQHVSCTQPRHAAAAPLTATCWMAAKGMAMMRWLLRRSRCSGAKPMSCFPLGWVRLIGWCLLFAGCRKANR